MVLTLQVYEEIKVKHKKQREKILNFGKLQI